MNKKHRPSRPTEKRGDEFDYQYDTDPVFAAKADALRAYFKTYEEVMTKLRKAYPLPRRSPRQALWHRRPIRRFGR